MKIIITSFFLVLLLNSCIVLNLTKDTPCPDYCDKHHMLTGRTAVVKARYGKLDVYEYPFAKKPHTLSYIMPLWPSHRLVKIYECDKCTNAYKALKKYQKQMKKKNTGFIPFPEF